MRVAKGVYILLSLVFLGISACQEDVLETRETSDSVSSLQKQERTSFVAGFNNTSTRMELDGLNLRWTTGDRISVFGNKKDNSFSRETFTTNDCGKEATFEGKAITTTIGYYAFYPDSLVEGLAYQDKALIANLYIPTSQPAVADGIANNLNICYAQTTSAIEEHLIFQNVCALIKFRLIGEGAETVKKVRFTANRSDLSSNLTLSGDVSMLLSNREITCDKGYDYIELQGDYEEGYTYYIMCAPALLNEGFTLSLFNDQGMECTKRGLNATTLCPSEILNLGDIQINNKDFTNGLAMHYLSSNSEHPVSWVVIPEGYTKEQLNDYHSQAKEMLDFIFGIGPFKEYQSYFNVHILDAVSEEQGADDTDQHLNVKTAFDAGWSTASFSNMSANAQRVFGFVETHNPDILRGKVTINETGIIMLINDNRYGGRSQIWSNGKSFAMIPISTNSNGSSLLKWIGNGGSEVTCEGSWLNIALHEAGGHMFGKLADEYIGGAKYYGKTIPSHSYAVPYGLNITADLENNLLWSDLIPDNQGIKQDGKFLYVNTYEGGLGVYSEGVWRSEEISCMGDNRPYFSAWQRYLIAKRIHDLAQEPFTYDDFITSDNQYGSIQQGVQYAGTEGIITTIFELDGIRYNSSLTKNRSSLLKSSDIMPPLPPPVLIEDK